MAARGEVEEMIGEVRSKMSLEEEEDVVVEVEEEDEVDDESEGMDRRWCLVGRFATTKKIKFNTMRVAMGDLWKPGKGLYCKELDSKLFLFQFFHEIDFKRAWEGAPWTFDDSLLVWKKLEEGVNPRLVSLYIAEFWVQLHDLEPGWRKEKVCEAAEKHLGSYIDCDSKNFDKEKGREYMRIRAAIDITKSLKRKMKLMKGGKEITITFQYERLPAFCFVCGIIGHGERQCAVLYDNLALTDNKPFGVWLRA